MDDAEKRMLWVEHEMLLREYLDVERDMHLHREEAQKAWHRLRRLRRRLGNDAPALKVRVWGM